MGSKGGEGVIGGRTDFVEDEDELLALGLAPAYFLLDEPAPAALRIARVENQNDDVALVDNLVKRAHIVAPHLLLRTRLRRHGRLFLRVGRRLRRHLRERRQCWLCRHQRVWILRMRTL